MRQQHARTTLLGRKVSRRSMLAGAAVGVATPVVVTAAGGMPLALAAESANTVGGRTRRVTMYAQPLPDGLIGYGLSPDEASVPGPVLEIWEGDTLEIELVNNTDSRLSIHPHGVDYSVDSDGSPLNGSFNEPGETRTYVWRTRAPAKGPGSLWLPGSAGYWHYHDHAMGGDHGTEGLRKGLYGALVVRRKGDILPDRQYTVVFNDMTINNRVAPDVPVLEANLGERVEFIAIGHGNNFHTFHLHAHRWADNRTGYLEGPNDPSRVIDNRDLNPGDSFGFQVIAGEGVGPGAWMYHCHVQFHSDGGMAGVFLVRNADGSMPDGAQKALDRYHRHGDQ
ncbi:FtsP/CotA-like multicopper oxidase with cupredoxin domain [Saccharomonospora amisosensis]|uniref:FtsP/CotA-like multicopper oxidase with cupredoxin domain n=1 Tax=Saccharomonospora amisosensis TaxID=1128677 RepID=A0A7X5ZRC5_9PSEU|nr:multicopper oxidase domain-containing protein [Saccharomonospora amisosensis]NIJ12386.1 FtsP/CotA-like multicopper oxidase with cupredoxin domain [Saccharomonospora amisosensis]